MVLIWGSLHDDFALCSFVISFIRGIYHLRWCLLNRLRCLNLFLLSTRELWNILLVIFGGETNMGCLGYLWHREPLYMLRLPLQIITCFIFRQTSHSFCLDGIHAHCDRFRLWTASRCGWEMKLWVGATGGKSRCRKQTIIIFVKSTDRLALDVSLLWYLMLTDNLVLIALIFDFSHILWQLWVLFFILGF